MHLSSDLEEGVSLKDIQPLDSNRDEEKKSTIPIEEINIFVKNLTNR